MKSVLFQINSMAGLIRVGFFCTLSILSTAMVLSQSGHHQFQFNYNSSHQMELEDQTTTRSEIQTITFDTHFQSVPQIALGIDVIDTGFESVTCSSLTAEQITTTGFDLKLEAFAQCRIFSTGARWFATISQYISIAYQQFNNIPTGVQEFTFTGLNSRSDPGAQIFVSGFRQEKSSSTTSFSAEIVEEDVTSSSVKIKYEMGSSVSDNNMLKVCLIHYQKKAFTTAFSAQQSSSDPGGAARNPPEEFFGDQSNGIINPSPAPFADFIALNKLTCDSTVRFQSLIFNMGDTLDVNFKTWEESYIIDSRITYLSGIKARPIVQFTIS